MANKNFNVVKLVIITITLLFSLWFPCGAQVTDDLYLPLNNDLKSLKEGNTNQNQRADVCDLSFFFVTHIGTQCVPDTTVSFSFGEIDYKDKENHIVASDFPPIPGLSFRSCMHFCQKDSCTAERLVLAVSCPPNKKLLDWVSLKICEPGRLTYHNFQPNFSLADSKEICDYYISTVKEGVEVEEHDTDFYRLNQGGMTIADVWQQGNFHTFFVYDWYTVDISGRGYCQWYTIDATTGTELGYEDIIDKGDEVALADLLCKYWKLINYNDDDISMFDNEEKLDMLHSMESCAVTKEGLLIDYYNYETPERRYGWKIDKECHNLGPEEFVILHEDLEKAGITLLKPYTVKTPTIAEGLSEARILGFKEGVKDAEIMYEGTALNFTYHFNQKGMLFEVDYNDEYCGTQVSMLNGKAVEGSGEVSEDIEGAPEPFHEIYEYRQIGNRVTLFRYSNGQEAEVIGTIYYDLENPDRIRRFDINEDSTLFSYDNEGRAYTDNGDEVYPPLFVIFGYSPLVAKKSKVTRTDAKGRPIIINTDDYSLTISYYE